MSDGHIHNGSHHHHATTPRFSLLRASAAQRLTIVAGAALILWAAVAWAVWL